MSTTNVSIRLGVEGKAEVKRAFEEVGQAGTQAFGQVDRALEKTGAATDREAARFKRLAEAARMAAQADAAQGRFNQVLGVDRQAAGSARASAEVFEQAAREAERYEARAKALRATLDPLAAAQDRLNTELAEHAALASRGAITTAEQAAANVLAKSRFDQTAQAIRQVGANSKLTTQQVMTLQYTVNDVIASMSTGMSPMTILMQQGGQVTQAFGGLRGTIMTLGSAIGVVGGVIAGVAVSVGVLTAAWFANDASTRAVSTALAGVGRASGATAAQLEQVAQSSAEAGKISVSSARDMQVAFLRTGKIGAEEMGRAIAVSRNLGVTLGVETKQGAEELARALADPLRGADELNDRIRFLDDRTRAYVRTLVDQNNRAEAQRVILNALAPSLADAEQAVNALGRAWQFVGRSASNAFDALGKAVDRAVDGRTPTEELDLLRWQQERLRANVRGNVVPLMLPQVERRIAELERQLNDQQDRARRIAAEARANEQSVRAGEIARDTNPGAREIERLRTQEGVLRAALADPLVRSKLADVAEVEAAYRRVVAELARYRPSLDAATQAVVEQTSATDISIRATLSLAEAYLESAEAAARAEARRQGLVDQAREGVNAETRARQVLRERIAEQAVEAARQVLELGRQIDGQRRLNEAMASGAVSSQRAQQIMQVEQALRPLITAQTLAEGEAKEKLGRIIDRTREAYEQLHREQNRTDLLQDIERRRDEIALRERELSLVRRGPAARREGVDQLRFEQELKRMGIDPNDPEAAYSREQIKRLNQLGRQTAGREANFDYEQSNTGLAREVELLKQGASARSEAIAMIRAEQQLRRQGIDPAGAEGQAALAAARRQFALERQAEAQVALQDQRAEIGLIETQIDLIGASAQQRETVLGTIRAEQDLRRRGIDLASEEGRAIVANAVRVQQLTTELQRQEATQRALQGAIGNALDRFGTLLAQGKTDWKSWADAGQAAINDFMNELIKLAVMNPLKNFLFGGNAPTLATGGGIFGELGKIFAGLFHEGGLGGAGGPGRNVPALLFAGAPRLHGGGYIRPGEVPAILQTGERVLNRRETAAYDQPGEQAAPMVVTFNITTPDAGSFRRAQGQITAEMASALERARRNL
jgi:hypothetical protein